MLEKELSSGKNRIKNYLLKNQKSIQILNDIIKQAKNIFLSNKEKNELEKIINDTNSGNDLKQWPLMN